MIGKGIQIFVLLCLLGLGAWVALVFGLRDNILNEGDEMPEIKYISENTQWSFSQSNEPILIYYFKPDCPHCEYELKVLNEKHNNLEMVNVYCLTTNEGYIYNREYLIWKNLVKSDNITFGYVDKKEYVQHFGADIAPVFYLFNKERRLTDKIVGETKFDRILDAIRKSGDAQRRTSGLN